MPDRHPTVFSLASLLFVTGVASAATQEGATDTALPAASAALTSPDSFLGFTVGADFRLADWDSITAYFYQLAAASPAVRVDTLGATTLGNPLTVVTVTAPENMARLDEIRANQAKLADPRKLVDGELDALLESQPTVVLIAHNIHSTEVASSQGVMELAYTLITDPKFEDALRQVVVLLIPSVNPDGQLMIVDWYRRTLGSPYEGSAMPWLYHHYVGHDNNRDWFMLTQAETQLINDLLYERWFPEVVYDVHQMGNRGARFFVPPFDDPLNPNLDPLVVRMISLVGLQMSVDLEAAGKSGVVNGERYDLWWHGGNRSTPTRHNMIGILSEAASARIASPIFQEPAQVDRQPQFGSGYPNPWPGGWWRARDIVEYQLIAARSLIGLAARQRRQLISNYVEMGRRAIRAGEEEPPYAFVVPATQPDPGSAARTLELLRRAGVEIHRAGEAFEVDAIEYSEGSWIVFMAQPYRAHAKDLLERQRYPDRRLYPGGPPDSPYDVSGWTLPLQMGVEVVAVMEPFEVTARLETDSVRAPPGSITGAGSTLVVDYAANAANLAIHRALESGVEVTVLAEPRELGGHLWPIGTPVLEGDGAREILDELAQREGLSALATSADFRRNRLSPIRVGLYQSWAASMDEGWTRWVFETWEVPYRTLHDAEIRNGDLRERYDVIVLPDLTSLAIVEGRKPGTVPAQYTGGWGDAGIAAIRAFVTDGGTLVCLSRSSGFAIEQFSLPIRDVRPDTAAQRAGTAFYAPGSILRVELDQSHPLAYGMPLETSVYYSDSPVFEVEVDAADVTSVAQYPESGQLLSGYALHSDFLAGKAALLEARYGAGRIVLFGFRPQHRGQSQETFKILFNAIYRGTLAEEAVAE